MYNNINNQKGIFMKDILGREVNPGDLVVVKGTGRYNCGLRVGLMREKAVKFSNMTTANYGQCFKIVNPTPEELEIKENILKHEREQEEHKLKLKEERMSKKAIPKKELEIGRMYIDDKGNRMYFLGEGLVYKQRDEWDNRWSDVFYKNEGIILITIDEFAEKKYGMEVNYNTCELGLNVRKTIPRFVEVLEIKVELNDVLELVDPREKPEYSYIYTWSDRCRNKITIELNLNK